MNTCQALTKDGEPCPSNAGVDGYCFWHSPTNAAAADLARLKGGLNRRAKKTGECPGDLSNLDDLRRWLSSSLADTWELENSVRRSSALASLLRIAVEVVGQAEIDSKLEALDRMIHEQSSVNKQA